MEVAALTIPFVMPGHGSNGDIVTAALLASLSVAYSALSGAWELARKAMWTVREVPDYYRNFLAVWCFAAAVTLPPLLATSVVAVSTAAEWPGRKIFGRATTYRYIYSSASAVIVAALAGVLSRIPVLQPFPVVAAAVAYIAIGPVPVVLAQLAVGSRPNLKGHMAWKSLRIEVWTVTVGVGEWVLLNFHLLAWVWLSLPLALGMQRWVFRAEVNSPATLKDSPMSQQSWLLVAREVIRACPVGAIMRIETPDPAAATALARIKAGCDAIGMTGKSGLAVLLTQCPGDNADALADRMRAILKSEKIDGEIAVAAKPRDGNSLDDLLAVSEAELITRMAATRPAKFEIPDS